MFDAREKTAFYACVSAGQAARWTVADGVAFFSRREYLTWGIALQIDSRALQPQQLGQSLERRFEMPELFNDYFLFLDPLRDFVVWHAVPPSSNDDELLDEIREHQLALAGLDHLRESHGATQLF